MNLHRPAPFCPRLDHVEEDWKTWKMQFKIYLNFIKAYENYSEQERALLLTNLMGVEAIRAMERISFEDPNDQNDMDILMCKFDAVFDPALDEVRARYKFFSRRKENTENIEEYVADLMKIANSCGFEEQYDKMIVDMIIRQSSFEFRKYIFTLEKISLPDLLEQYKELEVNSQRIEEISKKMEMELNNQYNPNYKNFTGTKPKTRPVCSKCRLNHPYGACPAFNEICQKCFEKGHFTNCCKKDGNAYKSNNHKPIYCLLCNGMTHKSEMCPYSSLNKNNDQVKQNYSVSPTQNQPIYCHNSTSNTNNYNSQDQTKLKNNCSTIYCFACKNIGHKSEVCPLKSANNQQQAKQDPFASDSQNQQSSFNYSQSQLKYNWDYKFFEQPKDKNDFSTIHCFSCKSIGHKAETCPLNRVKIHPQAKQAFPIANNQNRDSYSQNQPQNIFNYKLQEQSKDKKDVSTIHCFLCKNAGHKADTCPSNRANILPEVEQAHPIINNQNRQSQPQNISNYKFPENSRDKKEFSTIYSTIYCSNCKNHGHKTEACGFKKETIHPQVKQAQPIINNQNQSQPQNINNHKLPENSRDKKEFSTIYCSNCKNHGHKSDACSLKKETIHPQVKQAQPIINNQNQSQPQNISNHKLSENSRDKKEFSTIYCSNCNNRGHKSDACSLKKETIHPQVKQAFPTTTNSQNRQSSSQSQPQNSINYKKKEFSTIYCSYCNNIGHKSEACPIKRKDFPPHLFSTVPQQNVQNARDYKLQEETQAKKKNVKKSQDSCCIC